VKALARILLSTAVAVFLLGALAVWGGVDAGEIVAASERLSPATYLLALGVHLGIHAVRAARFRLLIPPAQRPSFAAMLAISSAHNLAVYVLPAKTGEGALVVYLRTHCGVSAKAGLASLLVSRLLDLATLCAALAAACLYVSSTDLWQAERWVGAALGASFLVLAALFYALASRGQVLVAVFAWLVCAVRADRASLGRRLLSHSLEVGDALRFAAEDGRVLRALPLSLLVWAGVFVFYAILARGFGLPAEIGLAEAAFGSSLAVLTNLLPVNALAGFGTQEAGWVLGFGLLGVSRELSFSTGVGVHVVQLFNTCLTGLLGHLAMGALPRPAAEKAP